mmetsp:Transcript_7557/g.21110  ORF Transcript_7557/g.21110 Transcript_7557/m.21110 type:complete len:213 (+) Transcript_7557:497-1135(+)
MTSSVGFFRGLRLGSHFASKTSFCLCRANASESSLDRSLRARNAPRKSRRCALSSGKDSGYGAITPSSLAFTATAGKRLAPPNSPSAFMRSCWATPSTYAKATLSRNDSSRRTALNSSTRSRFGTPPDRPLNSIPRSWPLKSKNSNSMGLLRASYRAKFWWVNSPTAGKVSASTHGPKPMSGASSKTWETSRPSFATMTAGVRSANPASIKA